MKLFLLFVFSRRCSRAKSMEICFGAGAVFGVDGFRGLGV